MDLGVEKREGGRAVGGREDALGLQTGYGQASIVGAHGFLQDLVVLVVFLADHFHEEVATGVAPDVVLVCKSFLQRSLREQYLQLRPRIQVLLPRSKRYKLAFGESLGRLERRHKRCLLLHFSEFKRTSLPLFVEQPLTFLIIRPLDVLVLTLGRP